MTNEKYSITEAQDLADKLKSVFVFIDSGVPSHDLPPEILDALLDYASRAVGELNLVLRG